MAEEPEGNGEETLPAAPPKGSRIKQFLTLAIVVLAMQCAVAYVLVTRFVVPQETVEETAPGEAPSAAEAWPEVHIEAPLLYNVGDLILNPKDPETLRFCAAGVVIELDSEDALVELGEKLIASKIHDLVRQTLANTATDEMDSPQDRKALREVVKTRINESGILEGGQVTSVYFSHFVIQ